MDLLDGQNFLRAVAAGSANLFANKKIVNDLNVFPIPDGDTGENMYKTISGGVESAICSGLDNIGEAAQALESGMLVNARGNSGVILSQFFAGVASGLSGLEVAGAKELSVAFTEGVKSAYKSVVTPTEGTILTVSREGAEFAARKINENSTVESFLSDCTEEMKRSLERTPDLLPVLKEAGVIDSGGAGLIYIVDGMLKSVRGEDVGEEDLTVKETAAALDFGKFTEDSVMEFGYCTELLLRLQRSKTDIDNFSLDEVIDYLGTIGDSIVAIKNGTIVKIHVHTMTPYKVLEFCQRYGEYLTVKIENMTLQHNEITGIGTDRREEKTERKKYACVVTATGEGLKNAFKDMNADFVVDGGQTNNPSAEDFIKAFDKVNADFIFVLPNNGNVILTAKQAANLYEESKVYVVETKNIGEGYAVLSMLDYGSDDPEEIYEGLNEAMNGVVTGMVSKATRSVNLNGVDVKESEYIGFSDKTMLCSDKEKTDATLELLEKLGITDHELLILIYGAGVTDEEKEAVRAGISSMSPRTEEYEIDGGQDVYDCFVILE